MRINSIQKFIDKVRGKRAKEQICNETKDSCEDTCQNNPALDQEVPEQENTAENIAKFTAGGEDYFSDVAPEELSSEMLVNCKILPNREKILDELPKGGVVVEVGTQTGYFAKKILEVVKPKILHIIDIDYTPFDKEYFAPFVERGQVVLHQGDSATLLSEFSDKFFDMIYVDGDHSYTGAKRDISQAVKKVKDNGIIICNDYTVFSPLEGVKYGVPRAANEAMIEDGFEAAYLGLHKWGYHDLAIKKKHFVIWQNGLSNELSFWNKVLNKEIYEKYLENIPYQLQPKIVKNLSKNVNEEISILDVGSGPITKVGSKYKNHLVSITMLDPLAEKYTKLLDSFNVQRNVNNKIIKGTAEEINSIFPDEEFDIVYSLNALDHSYDPILSINNMVNVCKASGAIIITVVENEASFLHYDGLHQWDFTIEDDQIVLYSNTRKRFVLDEELDKQLSISYDTYNEMIGEFSRRFINITINKP